MSEERPTQTAGITDREWARARVERKRKLRADAVAYVVVNGALVIAWVVTGAGYFWPGWVLGGWAVMLLLEALGLHYRRPVTDAEIDGELRRLRHA